jgi:O-antigen/teichoic acid export membrane protein
MRRHLQNAAYGVLDYASYPFGMLLVAPIVLHRLGAAEYGVWTIATAVISIGGIIASGFCDANIQRVAKLRGSGDAESMLHVVRSMLGINLVAGLTLAVVFWMAAPYAAGRIAAAHVVRVDECVTALRIASALILVRAVESVAVSTQRAFEDYRNTVRISAAVRVFTLATAGVLALSGRRSVSILVATGIFMAVGTSLQLRGMRRLLRSKFLWPAFHAHSTRVLLGCGFFSWLQAVGSVAFGQLDRLLLGVSLGALAVAPYSLCVQFAQPIFGLTAAALQFLFPYLSRRAELISDAELKRTLFKAFLCNLLLVACGAGLLLLFGDRVIELWAGAAVAKSAAKILPPIVLGSSLMGLSVTGIYAMLALGLFRTVAGISLATRAVMLLLMAYLLHRAGLQGLVISRVGYGVFALAIYLPLFRRFRATGRAQRPATSLAISCELQEGSKP